MSVFDTPRVSDLPPYHMRNYRQREPGTEAEQLRLMRALEALHREQSAAPPGRQRSWHVGPNDTGGK